MSVGNIQIRWSSVLIGACVVVAAVGCSEDVGETEEVDNQFENDEEQPDVCCLPPDADNQFGLPDTPTELTATDGEYEDYVRLGWSEVDEATEYNVYRDGESVAVVEGTSYEDGEADEGGLPDAPSSLEATEGEHSLEVVLDWEEPEVEDGPAHTYEVAAVEGETVGERSEAADGYRAGYEIDHYEVEVDGGDWTVTGEQTHYTDVEAPVPEIDFGTVTATRGDHVDYVVLDRSGLSHQPGETVDYRVRAVNETGPGAATDTEQGFAQLDEDELQWQRSVGEEGDEFVYIDGATEETYEDVDAPSDASLRWYRVAVGEGHEKAAGIVASDAVPGFRIAPVDWFDRQELEFYEGDIGQAELIGDPVQVGDRALETDGNNEEIVSVEGDGLDHYPGLGDDFYVWIRSDFSESMFEGPHIYWGPGTGYDDKPVFETRIRDHSQEDTYLQGPGGCEATTPETLEADTWYRLEIQTSEDGHVDKAVYDTDDQLEYSMEISCDVDQLDVDTDGIGFRAGGFGTSWYDHWTMTQLDYQ